MSRRYPVLVACALSVLLSGCDKPPSSEGLPTWTPRDHGADPETAGASDGRARPGSAPRSSPGATAFMAQCATCHGPSGRGDGPQAAGLSPPDLTSAAWQSSHDAKAIEKAIREGKGGKMPKFSLPDDVVAALVAHVRQLGAPRAPASPSGGTPDAGAASIDSGAQPSAAPPRDR